MKGEAGAICFLKVSGATVEHAKLLVRRHTLLYIQMLMLGNVAICWLYWLPA